MDADIEGKVQVIITGNRRRRGVAIVLYLSSEQEYEVALKQVSDQVDAGHLNIKFKPRGGDA